jgi:hypothetical protein
MCGLYFCHVKNCLCDYPNGDKSRLKLKRNTFAKLHRLVSEDYLLELVLFWDFEFEVRKKGIVYKSNRNVPLHFFIHFDEIRRR